jgi:methionyl-tRNA formyltransferase
MRLAFMGTPEFAVPTLDALVANRHEIVAVYTQPPRPAGRGKKLMLSAVQARAEELGLSVRSPVSLRNAEAQAEFAALNLDIAVVAAYGLILPQAILDAPKHGCLNVHGSLLPRWRGAAPVQRAILAGDVTTGVMVMQMEAGLDTGPVRAATEIEIGYKTTGGLTTILAGLGAQLMVKVLSNLSAYPAVPQTDEGVTYANKIDKNEARLDFSVGAIAIERQIRAFNPSPGAWFEYQGERIRILNVAVLTASPSNFSVSFSSQPGLVLDDQLCIGCGDGAIRPTTLQKAGGSMMDTLDFLRGKPIPVGTILK